MTNMQNYWLNQGKINQILNEFNFVDAEAVMMVLQWKWAINGAFRRPTIQEMEDFARDLLIAAEQDGNTVASGGFEAGIENGELYLKFIAVIE